MNTMYDGDLRLVHTTEGGAVEFRTGQPLMDQGLETAAYISLFTDSGWWGNEPSEDIGCNLGKILSGTLTTAALNQARDEVARSLAWLTADGISDSVDVQVEAAGVGVMYIAITITEPDKLSQTALRYRLNWDAQRSYMEASLV